MDLTITLPNGGGTLVGTNPVVVIGPNGSGKTRKTRELQVSPPVQLDFINALRNTRVASELQAAGVATAKNNYNNTKNNSRSQPWEMSTEFDWMLSDLLAEHASQTMRYHRLMRTSEQFVQPPETVMSRLEKLWAKIFEGRELSFDEWRPTITNSSAPGGSFTYSGTYMSDGEKAALYLIGRVLMADPCVVIVVDEPETHFHSLLAVRLWDALEDERRDVRFVYVTHDLTFALSRHNARFVLASPTAAPGLRPLDLDTEAMPSDVAEALLGAASLSFYASRILFCEGTPTSYDVRLYGAWFNGRDTVVRSVAKSSNVIRCVQTINDGLIATSLKPVGIVDSDYHPDAWKDALPANVTVLRVHEVESLFALPEVVKAVCAQTGRAFDPAAYHAEIRQTFTEDQAKAVVVDRWKASMEPKLEALLSASVDRNTSVADLIVELPNIFDHSQWKFSPKQLLEAEQDRVHHVLHGGTIEDLLLLVPGKQMLAVAARTSGLGVGGYVDLVVTSLRTPNESTSTLAVALSSALSSYLPERYSPASGLPGPL